MYKIKNDKFKKNRGGASRVLDICCEHCGNHICYYQKDGPGGLRRMYVDRMIDLQPDEEMLRCKNCGHDLAVKIIYKKENRLAYRLFAESVKKKIVRSENVWHKLA